jgi:Ca-activated chloride channel family protein
VKFALPQLLWLLLLVPLLAVFLVWAWRTKERLIAQFVQSRLLAQLTVGVSKTRQKVRLALLVSAVALAVLALARPQWGFSWEEVSQKGLDIVVAIDTSRSMLAADIPPNRLERAKLAAMDLMKLARNDRLGLVAFAGSSFLQCPLTLDEEAFRQGVAALDVNIIPQGGTAIAETIQTALSAFKDGDNHKILVLFTDGEDHEAGVLEAAKAASDKGLRIFTIGVGSAAGELIRVRDEKGKMDFLKDESGNVVKSKLNETLLQQIAGAAGGFYLPLRGANTMDLLYERGLAPLPKSEFNAKLMQRHHERFYWPLGIAVVLLIVEMFLPERQKVRRPAVNTPGANLSVTANADATAAK